MLTNDRGTVLNGVEAELCVATYRVANPHPSLRMNNAAYAVVLTLSKHWTSSTHHNVRVWTSGNRKHKTHVDAMSMEAKDTSCSTEIVAAAR